MTEELKDEKTLAVEYQKLNNRIFKIEKFKLNNNGKLPIEQENLLKEDVYQKKELEKKLTNSKDTSFTNGKIESVIQLLHLILKDFKDIEIDSNLTNTQGLMFENGIYNCVIWDIERTLVSSVFCYPVRSYETSKDSVFNKEELQKCIEKLKESLELNRPKNYVELDNMISKSLEKISIL